MLSPTDKSVGSGTFWCRRFGDDYLAPAFWRRAVLALGCFGASVETDQCV